MKRGVVVGTVVGTIALLVAIFWWLLSGVTLDVLHPTGQVAAAQRDLFWLTIGLSSIVVVPVFIMLVVFAWKYSDKTKKKSIYRPEWRSNHWLEIIWWGIPILIISVLAVVTWQTSHSLDPYKSIASNQKPVEVQVLALQWKWLFLYPEQKIAVINELPIVKDRPVHFTISADSPMSAFWIPTLGSQIYSMNGMRSQLNLVANKTGDYYGYNTNINGEGYASMRFTVKVRDEGEFNRIMAEAQKSPIVLDEVLYKYLSQPSIEKNTVYYRLADQDLYNQIVMKYMRGNLPKNHNSNTIQDDKNNSMHDMRGM